MLSVPAPGLYACILPLFSNIFFSETAWLIKVNYYTEPPLEGGTKLNINGLGHMTKMAATPIYAKKLLLLNRNYYDLETWHAASETQRLTKFV